MTKRWHEALPHLCATLTRHAYKSLIPDEYRRTASGDQRHVSFIWLNTRYATTETPGVARSTGVVYAGVQMSSGENHLFPPASRAGEWFAVSAPSPEGFARHKAVLRRPVTKMPSPYRDESSCVSTANAQYRLRVYGITAEIVRKSSAKNRNCATLAVSYRHAHQLTKSPACFRKHQLRQKQSGRTPAYPAHVTNLRLLPETGSSFFARHSAAGKFRPNLWQSMANLPINVTTPR